MLGTHASFSLQKEWIKMTVLKTLVFSLPMLFIILFKSIESYRVNAVCNAYLPISSTESFWLNGTCNECFCHAIMRNLPMTSFNCFKNNTCLMFNESFVFPGEPLMRDENSTFFFIGQRNTTLIPSNRMTSQAPGEYSWFNSIQKSIKTFKFREK